MNAYTIDMMQERIDVLAAALREIAASDHEGLAAIAQEALDTPR